MMKWPCGLPAIASRSGAAGGHLCGLYVAYRKFIKQQSKWIGREMHFFMTVPFRLVCGVGGASSHYQIACHVHYLFFMAHFEIESTFT
jgi:hypothetical protein